MARPPAKRDVPVEILSDFPRYEQWQCYCLASLRIRSRNARHCSPLTSITPPARLWESLTRTDEHQTATSTQFPESALALLLRQTVTAYRSR
jgi:hypothetical protein